MHVAHPEKSFWKDLQALRVDKNGEQPVQALPLAIVGMGCLFPKAANLRAFWANIRDGVDCIESVPDSHWNPADYFDADKKRPDHTYAARGGFLPAIDFHPLDFGIAPSALDATDTSQLLGLVAARQALEDAGYGEAGAKPFDRNRTSVILGVTGALELVIPLGARLGHPLWRKALTEFGVDPATAEKVVDRISQGYVEWQENSFPGLLGNVVAGRIANRLDLGGTNCVVDAACASSLSALHLATLELQAGLADMVVTGGVDTFNDIFMYMCFSKTPALSPTGDARPFAAEGDGTILGEGLGMLVVKRLADATRDGDRIYAVIKGIGTSSDGKGNAIYAPSAAGQKKALLAAYRASGVEPRTIDLVEAHGTGTKVGDATELAALVDVFRESEAVERSCAVGSVKSQIGHTKAAAGAAGMVKAALALYHKVLPPSIKVQRPLDPLMDDKGPFYLNANKRPWVGRADHPRRAAVSAFGFGGSNFHCVLEEAASNKRHVDWSDDVEFVALSAADESALRHSFETIAASANWPQLQLAAHASRATFRPTDAVRMTLVVEKSDFADEQRCFVAARRALQARAEPATERPHDDRSQPPVFISNSKPGKLAAVFAGQGSQRVGMGLDLACLFPEMLEAIELADSVAALANPTAFAGPDRLSDWIFPRATFGDAAKALASQESRLRRTDIAQPALAAVELGMLAILQRFGIEFDAVAGHSFGELAALHAAGAFDAETFLKLANQRGLAMASAAGEAAGGMLAVKAAPFEVRAALESIGAAATVANENGPEQTVVAGDEAALEAAARHFADRKWSAVRLPVGAAFHSSIVAAAANDFADVLAGADMQAPTVPVIANSTAQPYPANAARMRDLLANQLAQTVKFADGIAALRELGVVTFVEVGPGAKLAKLIESNLAASTLAGGATPPRAFAVDASEGKRSAMLDLTILLARLAARGHGIRLSAWNERADMPQAPPASKPKFGVRLTGANFVPQDRRDVWRGTATQNGSTNGVAGKKPDAAMQPKVAANAAVPARSSEIERPPTGTANLHRTPSAIKPIDGMERRPATNMENPLLPQPRESGELPAKPAAVVRPAGAIDAIQRNLDALRKMQEQTSQVHLRYLEGQEAALAAYCNLLEVQNRVLVSDGRRSVETSPLPFVSRVAPKAEPQRAPPPTMKAAERTNAPPETAPAPMAPKLPEARAAAKGLVDGVLNIVAEKTGYPVEMLELDMQLDADLGIDSIKRVEILSAVQERFPETPAIASDRIGSLRTLREVVAQLGEIGSDETPHRRDACTKDSASDDREPINVRIMSASANGLVEGVLAIVAEKTGYPVEMLELDMQLDADLGIDSIKRVEILSAVQERFPETPAIASDRIGSLRTLREVVAQLGEIGSDETPCRRDACTTDTASGGREPALAQNTPTSTGALARYVVQSTPLPPTADRSKIALCRDSDFFVADNGTGTASLYAAELKSRGIKARPTTVLDLLAAELPRRMAGLLVLSPAPVADRQFLSDVLQLARKCVAPLAAAARADGSLFAVLSHLDGAFGTSGAAADPISGALAGLAKTAAREWPSVTVRAIDASADVSPAAVVDELLVAGPVESGIGGRGGVALQLMAQAISDDVTPWMTDRALTAGDLVIVTGGARGVTAAVAGALAKAFGATLSLWGRTEFDPAAEPAWQAALGTEADLKRELAKRSPQATPLQLGAQAKRVLAQREIRATLDGIAASGSKVEYRMVDVRDRAAVRRAIAESEAAYGPVAAVVHGAGVLADRRIEDKTREDFEAVFGPKVDGLVNLLTELADRDLKAVVAFSSTTGRLGRVGQADYAMANEALNKLAVREASRRSNCKVVAANWGPWAGGMVGPELERVFAAEGIGLIGLEQGADALVRELRHKGPVEVVYVGSELPAQETRPWKAQAASSACGPAGSMDLTQARSSDGRLPGGDEIALSFETAFEREIDIATHPILEAHVFDGRPVVPMALFVEWLGHAALHANPGLAFHGLDNVRVLKRLSLEPSRRLWLQARVARVVRRDGLYWAPVELCVRHADGSVTVHVTATACLAESLPTSQPALVVGSGEAYPWPVERVYEQYLFHGPELHAVESIAVCDRERVVAKLASSPPPEAWLALPLRNEWLAGPMALDGAFQLAIVWSFENYGIGSLPTGMTRYRQFRRRFSAQSVDVRMAVKRHTNRSALFDIEWLDADGQLVARIDDYECTLSESLKRAFQRNRPALVEGR